MYHYEDIPDILCQKLVGYTVNEALERNIIEDVADENGDFIFKAKGNADLYFAIIDGYKVQCSQGLIKTYSPKEIDAIAGDLTFYRYFSKGKYHCRLGRPSYLDLEEPYVNVSEDLPKINLKGTESIQFKPLEVAPVNPEKGTIYFDNKFNKLRCYDGNIWRDCW